MLLTLAALALVAAGGWYLLVTRPLVPCPVCRQDVVPRDAACKHCEAPLAWNRNRPKVSASTAPAPDVELRPRVA